MTGHPMRIKKHRARPKKLHDVTNVLYLAFAVPFFRELFVVRRLISTFATSSRRYHRDESTKAMNNLLKTKSV